MTYAPDAIEFNALGTPAPGGSKSSFWHKAAKKRVMVDCGGKRTKDWRAVVRFAAIEAMDGAAPMRGPVSLDVEFRMRRPLHHFVGNDRRRELKENAPMWHLQAPDATKLLRSTEDAMKSIVWPDDAQVAVQRASKRWCVHGEPSGAKVAVRKLAASTSPFAACWPLFDHFT